MYLPSSTTGTLRLAPTEHVDVDELRGRGIAWCGEHVGAQRRRDGKGEAPLEVPETHRALIRGDRRVSGTQLRCSGRDQRRHDVGRARAVRLGNEHHRGDRRSIPCSEEGGQSERCVQPGGVVECFADEGPHDDALHGEGDEQASGAGGGDGGEGGGDAEAEQRGDQSQAVFTARQPFESPDAGTECGRLVEDQVGRDHEAGEHCSAHEHHHNGTRGPGQPLGPLHCPGHPSRPNPARSPTTAPPTMSVNRSSC